jgi:hypothetical protein
MVGTETHVYTDPLPRCDTGARPGLTTEPWSDSPRQ